MENDLNYYKRRVAEEMLAAERADSPEAQESHRQLAERYSVIVQQSEAMPAVTAEFGAAD
jgi:hypothetical protein